MNREVAERWTKALRSGRYKQGFGRLSVENDKGQKKYCCLGVLCKLLKINISKSDVSLGLEAMDKSGIKSPFGVLTTRQGIPHRSLAEINDTRQASFNKIADIIDKHWEDL
jgi:hypothetical protein